jgi:hypothetical protein
MKTAILGHGTTMFFGRASTVSTSGPSFVVSTSGTSFVASKAIDMRYIVQFLLAS